MSLDPTVPQSPVTPRWRERLATWGPLLLSLAAGLLVGHWPILLSGFRQMHGELGDTRLLMYVLEHTYQWISGSPLHASFWDPPIFWPAKHTLAYSEIMLGSAPLYWAWRVAGVRWDTAFQLWLLSVSVLNHLSAWALLRRGLRLSPWAAMAGALLFAFGAPRLAQSGHFQLMPQFPTMLFLWAGVESLRASRPRTRWGWTLAAGAMAVVQLYAGFYLGWFLGVGLGVAVVWALVLPAERIRLMTWARSAWAPVLAAAVLGVLALWPMARGYLVAARELGPRDYDEVLAMLPRLQSWLYVGEVSWLYGWSSKLALFAGLPPGFRHEHLLGVGVVTWILALAGLFLARGRPGLRIPGLAALTIFALTLMLPGDVTAWGVAHAVIPGASAVRALTRVALLMLVPLSMGLALTVDRVARSGRSGAVLAAGIAAVCLLEQGQRLPRYDKGEDRANVQFLVDRIPADCEVFFFTPVLGTRDWYTYLVDAMLASELRQLPTVNGYTGSWPPGYLPFWENVINQHENRDHVQRFLTRWTQERKVTFDPRCWVTHIPHGDRLEAEVLEVRVPGVVVAGQPFTATVRLRNAGTIAWVRSRHFRLGVVGPEVWAAVRAELPFDVWAGHEVVVELSLRAPSTPGRHRFEWRMLQEWMSWFGETATANVEVVAAGPGLVPTETLRAP